MASAVVESAVLLAVAAAAWQTRRPPAPAPARPGALEWGALAAAAAAVGITAFAFARQVPNVPHGDWDAWAIWNLHARFLALGASEWRLLFRPELTFSHNDYPLLLPAIVARTWAWSAGTNGPIVVAGLFTLAPLLAVYGAVARRAGLVGSAVAPLLLAGTGEWVVWGLSQGTDVPIAALVVAALACLTVAGDGASESTLRCLGLVRCSSGPRPSRRTKGSRSWRSRAGGRSCAAGGRARCDAPRPSRPAAPCRCCCGSTSTPRSRPPSRRPTPAVSRSPRCSRRSSTGRGGRTSSRAPTRTSRGSPGGCPSSAPLASVDPRRAAPRRLAIAVPAPRARRVRRLRGGLGRQRHRSEPGAARLAHHHLGAAGPAPAVARAPPGAPRPRPAARVRSRARPDPGLGTRAAPKALSRRAGALAPRTSEGVPRVRADFSAAASRRGRPPCRCAATRGAALGAFFMSAAATRPER